MLTTDTTIINAYKNPVRHIEAKAAFYDDAALLLSINNNTALKAITLERTGTAGKFYGYGVSHKANIKVIDKDRNISIAAGNNVLLDIINGETALRIAPKMYITQVRRDEITNELSITAYDRLNDAAAHTVSELDIALPATIADYATQAAELLGLGVFYYADNAAFNTAYEAGANLDGTETIRELLDAIAEATQTVYYISRYNTLIFKSFDLDGAAAYTIDREQYTTMDSGSNRRLAAICSATELGDNVKAELEVSGTTQYIRDNPFYEMREDIATLIDAALLAIGGFTINQFDCEWRGNPAIEIGDKLALITKDGATAFSYLLDDVLEYDGTLKQRTQWKYEESNESESNPTSLGDALNKTFARVDKVNKQIELVASETTTNTEDIANIYLNTSGIQASVNRIETTTNAAIGAMNGELATLTQKVNASITAEDVRIEVQSQLDNGIDKITTNTGYTFDDEGLTVSKTGSEMTTQITEDGMTVSRDNTTVLTANNVGVVATNLHANTYLWIGKYSRLEDYDAEGSRTGCFWVGGS